MKWPKVFLFILLLGNLALEAQVSSTHGDHSDCDPGSILQLPPRSRDDAAKFLMRLQTAIADDEKKKTAILVRYPLSIGSFHGNYVVKSEKDFLQRYDSIFPTDVKAVIASEKVECIDITSQGFMIGNGTVWFNYDRGILKIISINPSIPRALNRSNN
jgi:hypothetical protein